MQRVKPFAFDCDLLMRKVPTGWASSLLSASGFESMSAWNHGCDSRLELALVADAAAAAAAAVAAE